MKKFFAILLTASVSMVLASPIRAIEDQDPVGTLTVGAHMLAVPGFGFNVFGDYVLVDSWWIGHFTVGAQLAYNAYSASNTTSAMGLTMTTHYHASRFIFTPRATYGVNILPQLEVHAGFLAGLGYEDCRATVTSGNVTTATETEPGPGIRLVVGNILGARYFFTDTFGASLELNYANYMPWVNAGVAFRF